MQTLRAQTLKAAQAPRAPARCSNKCHAAQTRRQVLETAALASLSAAVPLPALAKGKKGFQAIKDAGDGYEFLYPFGWQEVAVNGVDIVLKDVIEPLESVAVQLVPTEKKSITEYGTANEIAGTLANDVLTNPRDEVKLVKSEAELADGRDYVAFEFLQQSPRFTRHVLSAATVANGKLVIFTIGCNERRWNKMQEKLTSSVQSFKAFQVFSGVA